MRFSDYLALAWTNLWRRKGRTILTMTGVVIGTFAIVLMIALGLGLQDNMTSQLEAFGNAREITVMPKVTLSGSNPFGYNVDDSTKLDDEAVEKLAEIKGVAGVMPSFSLNTDTEVFIGRYSTSLTINGYDPKYSPADEAMDEGRHFTSDKGLSVVMGYKVPELFSDSRDDDQEEDDSDNDLYGMGTQSSSENPQRVDVLRKVAKIKIARTLSDGTKEYKNVRARVIGVIAEKGTQEDYSIYIPMQEAKDIYKWIENDETLTAKDYKYDSVKVTAQTTDDVERLVNDIQDLDYSAFSMKQVLNQMNNILSIIQIVLGAIGGISLLIASIGIINTMTMAIYERTREIGIMKVVGATLKNIRNIFLFEASIIGLIGGIIGVVVSLLLAMIGNLILSSVASASSGSGFSGAIFSLPFWLVAGGALFSALVGLVSGLYPAVKASKLSALTALRAE
jgi:putative ABC transport system permease protein